MFDKLQALVQRYNEIELLLAQPDVASDIPRLSRLAKERAELATIVQAHQRHQQANQAMEEARELANGDDAELAELAKEELPQLVERQGRLEQELKQALLPRDLHGDRNVVVEIRAGAGGDEASLFAADLYRMYLRFAQRRGWKVEMVSTSGGGLGGVKEVIFEVIGRGAYQHLKHESGVHRVQRVPVTEAQGRIHTSTATVAVLPHAEEIDVEIKPDDLRIDIFHSGGAGGQNVNKVATAVRIVHLSTGIVAVCQDERSQLKNRQKAMTVLRSRLLERELQAQQAQASATRRAQVGTGERSEKVRTYNFPQDRLTDHRIGLTAHGLEAILDGELDSIIQTLLEEEQTRLLQEAVGVRTVGQLLLETERRLATAGIGDARLEAELVWMTALSLDRTHLFASLRSAVQGLALLEAEELVTRRLRREPAAYLMGYREFFGLDFWMAPGVLVPRPETETVVEQALQLARRRHTQAAPLAIADVGTGSGVIAVSLAVHLSGATIYATDISGEALRLAERNAQRHGVTGRVRLLEGDLLSSVDQPLDLVAANLPYVMSHEIPTLEPEVRLYEPHSALDGGGNGLELIARLLATAGPHLKPGAALVLEMDPRQVDRATQLARVAFPGATISAIPDLTHRPRVLTVQL